MRGILFGDKHSWEDWKLILKERPDISFPEPKTNYIDLSGSDGQIDLSEVLTGEVKYKNRVGSFTFTYVSDRDKWDLIKTKISNYLHGKRMKIILDDDRSHYYIGRFSLNEWVSDKKTGDLVINYDLEPYKYDLTTSTEPWLWDPFSFVEGVIRNYDQMQIEPETTINLYGSRKTCVPTITVSTKNGSGFTVYGEYGQSGTVQWFNLPDGTYKDPDFIIRDGIHPYLFRKNFGTITFDYRGGNL